MPARRPLRRHALHAHLRNTPGQRPQRRRHSPLDPDHRRVLGRARPPLPDDAAHAGVAAAPAVASRGPRGRQGRDPLAARGQMGRGRRTQVHRGGRYRPRPLKRIFSRPARLRSEAVPSFLRRPRPHAHPAALRHQHGRLLRAGHLRPHRQRRPRPRLHPGLRRAGGGRPGGRGSRRPGGQAALAHPVPVSRGHLARRHRRLLLSCRVRQGASIQQA